MHGLTSQCHILLASWDARGADSRNEGDLPETVSAVQAAARSQICYRVQSLCLLDKPLVSATLVGAQGPRQ
jgi:hypothetical protein